MDDFEYKFNLGYDELMIFRCLNEETDINISNLPIEINQSIMNYLHSHVYIVYSMIYDKVILTVYDHSYVEFFLEFICEFRAINPINYSFIANIVNNCDKSRNYQIKQNDIDQIIDMIIDNINRIMIRHNN
jgi:hypothetical protein